MGMEYSKTLEQEHRERSKSKRMFPEDHWEYVEKQAEFIFQVYRDGQYRMTAHPNVERYKGISIVTWEYIERLLDRSKAVAFFDLKRSFCDASFDPYIPSKDPMITSEGNLKFTVLQPTDHNGFVSIVNRIKNQEMAYCDYTVLIEVNGLFEFFHSGIENYDFNRTPFYIIMHPSGVRVDSQDFDQMQLAVEFHKKGIRFMGFDTEAKLPIWSGGEGVPQDHFNWFLINKHSVSPQVFGHLQEDVKIQIMEDYSTTYLVG